jgi:hypothetical protein
LEDSSEPTNPVISRELAMGWLTNPVKILDQADDIISQSEARWLLIFDNADTPETLMDYWPLSEAGSVLVTSRDPLAKSSPSIASKSIDLSPLSADEGAKLLQQLSHSTKQDDLALEVSERLGGLPLAISQMAAIIRYQYLTLSEFLEKYDDESSRRQLHAFEEAGSRRQEARGNMSTIWAIEQLDPSSRVLLQLCSMLDPDCIEERILKDFDLASQHASDYPKDWMAYSRTRAELLKRSLVTRNEDRQELRIHRVVQDSLKAKMTNEQAATMFSSALALVNKAWGPTPLAKRHDRSLSKTREGLFPHALVLKTIFEKLYSNESAVAVPMAVLMNEAAW